MLNFLSNNSVLINNNDENFIVKIIDNELYYTNDITMGNDAIYKQIMDMDGNKNYNLIFYLKLNTNDISYKVNDYLMSDFILQINNISNGHVSEVTKILKNNDVLIKIITTFNDEFNDFNSILNFKNNLSNINFYKSILDNTKHAKFDKIFNESRLYNSFNYNTLIIKKKINFKLIDVRVNYDDINKNLTITLIHIGDIDLWSYKINDKTNIVKKTNTVSFSIDLVETYALKITIFNSKNNNIIFYKDYSFELNNEKSLVLSPKFGLYDNIFYVNIINNKFYINNLENPVLNIYKNKFYYIDQSSDSNISYPLGIFLYDLKKIYKYSIYFLNDVKVTPLTYLLNFDKSYTRYIILHVPKNSNLNDLRYNHLYNLYDNNYNSINGNAINVY